jgi:hypothetical protein
MDINDILDEAINEEDIEVSEEACSDCVSCEEGECCCGGCCGGC